MTDEQILQAMKSMLEPIQERLDSFEKGQQEIKERVTKIEVTQENDTSKRLDLLMEAQQEAAAKLQKLGRIESTLDTVKSDTEIIKSVVTEHSKSIRELKAVK